MSSNKLKELADNSSLGGFVLGFFLSVNWEEGANKIPIQRRRAEQELPKL